MTALDRVDVARLRDRGRDLYEFAEELFPVCRSITGDGTRRMLASISGRIPIESIEVPTGTRVFDWTIPKEWNIRDAWIARPGGERIVDFRRSNLHVVGHSRPVRATMPFRELRPHLFTLPGHPDWVPYRTSFYEEDWGFCLSENQLAALEDGEYEVLIDSSLRDGHMTYGECLLPGASEEEVLVSCHVCHPSLANDNLSGIAVQTFLAEWLAGRERRYSYRFLFVPGTIGAIAWLAGNPDAIGRVRHGLVLTCLGDRGGLSYKRSRRGDAEIDRVAAHVLGRSGEDCRIMDFVPFGSDERQYCSPGFDLPVGCLARSAGRPEHHTSADDMDLIHAEQLGRSLETAARIVEVLEGNRRYRNESPFGEPQLGRRGLHDGQGRSAIVRARLWVLNQSDGEHSLLDIAERSGLSFDLLTAAADSLVDAGLLAVAEQEAARR